jgi:hypothetical protein
MKYLEARDKIRDGDMIAVRGRRGIFSILTYTVTDSPYTHVGTAVWLDDGLWLAEINIGGNHLVPLSQLRDDFDVFDCPTTRENARNAILVTLREHENYGVVDVFLIALKSLFGISLRSTKNDVCSEYVARIYRMAGAKFDLPQIPTPKDLARELGEVKLTIRNEEK